MLEAGVFGQELVQGRHAAGEPGQVDPERPEPGVGAVDELAQGAGRAAVGGAERDELAGDLGAAALFDVPAGDQPAHRVAHEHDLGVGVGSALVPPLLQGRFDDRAEPLGVVPAGQPPVVGVQRAWRGRAGRRGWWRRAPGTAGRLPRPGPGRPAAVPPRCSGCRGWSARRRGRAGRRGWLSASSRYSRTASSAGATASSR